MRFAHQLDFATSGVLLAASSRAAAAAASRAFAERTARKRYRLLVLGHPAADAWRRTDAISYDPDDPAGFRMRATSAESEDPTLPSAPKAAATSFRVLARGVCALPGPFEGAAIAHVEAAPETGRRHQIRVHAAASGHPILGDCAYSPDRDSFRMFLHAARLTLPLRAPGKDGALLRTLRLRAPLPRSFEVAMTPPPRDDASDGEDGDE